jgi:hypothetical protein
MPIVEPYSKSGVGEQLLHGAFELNQIFLGQTDLLNRDEVAGAPGRPRVNIPLSLMPGANSPQKRGRADLVQAHS